MSFGATADGHSIMEATDNGEESTSAGRYHPPQTPPPHGEPGRRALSTVESADSADYVSSVEGERAGALRVETLDPDLKLRSIVSAPDVNTEALLADARGGGRAEYAQLCAEDFNGFDHDHTYVHVTHVHAGVDGYHPHDAGGSILTTSSSGRSRNGDHAGSFAGSGSAEDRGRVRSFDPDMLPSTSSGSPVKGLLVSVISSSPARGWNAHDMSADVHGDGGGAGGLEGALLGSEAEGHEGQASSRTTESGWLSTISDSVSSAFVTRTHGDASATADESFRVVTVAEKKPVSHLFLAWHYALTILVWCLVVGISIATSSVDLSEFLTTISLIGGIAASLLALIMPAACYLRLGYVESDYTARAVCGVVPNMPAMIVCFVFGMAILAMRLATIGMCWGKGCDVVKGLAKYCDDDAMDDGVDDGAPFPFHDDAAYADPYFGYPGHS